MRTLLALAIVATLLAPAAGQARRFGAGTRPLVLRIEGHVGAPREGDRKIAELTMRRADAIITFQVDEIWVLSGDAVGLDVLHEVEPYKPNMQVTGPGPVVDRLAHADPAQPLAVIGFFRSGQRILELSSVDPLQPKKR
jgi:hypothetical protein